VTAPVELTRYTITDQHYDPMHARNAFDVYLAVEADRLLSTLKEQLANAQSEAKFAREHLEREREKFAEITKDARAIRAYYATAHTMGFVNAPFWHELADETKQLYRDHIARSPALASLPGGGGG
jgi:hypothetical protein